MIDRASELRAIADGRLMLNVRNGVTVARSMLARIADEFEAMSTALAAKDVELAQVIKTGFERCADISDRAERAEAQLAEARKALEPFALVAEHDIGEDESDNDLFRPLVLFNRVPRIRVGHLRAVLAVVREAK